MKKKILIIICLVSFIACISLVALKLTSKPHKAEINEQTQVEDFISSLNNKLLQDKSFLNYGCISFDNRDDKLTESELDVSSITYKKPIWGYIFIEDVFSNKPKLTNFNQSLIYDNSPNSIKQITNYVFYFEDSEVSGTRYVSDYSYAESSGETDAYNIEYNVKYDKIFKQNCAYTKNVVNVKDYYDETLEEIGKDYDWTTSIKKACEEINKTGGILYFPYGTYFVSATKDEPAVLFLQSEHEIVVDFCNSKLELAGNNLGRYQMIFIKLCNNVTVKNGILQGDRMSHDYSDPGFGQFRTTHEGGYGISVKSATVANIYNMEIYDLTGDAVCLSNSYDIKIIDDKNYTYIGNPTTVNIDKCTLHHCRRQGVSVIDCKGFTITDSEIYSIGQFSWAYEEDCTDNNLKDVVVKGTAPSAGIDFEPDRNTFLVENALVKNCYIHNTDNYAMVNTTVADEIKEQGYLTNTPNLVIRNTLASSCPTLSGENFYENGVYRQAVVENSTFVYDKQLSSSSYDDEGNLKLNGAMAFTRLRFVKSRIIKTSSENLSLWTEDCEFYDCIFEQNKNTLNTNIGIKNGLVSFVRAKLVNNTFNNLIGTGENTAVYSSHGVVFMTNEEKGGGIADGSTGNIFNNCSVYLRLSVNVFNKDNNKDKINFNNCKIFAYPSSTDSVKFKNVNFYGCETKANSGQPIIFENCRLINSGAFANYERHFIDCYIEFEDLNEKIIYTDKNGNPYGFTPFGGHAPGDSKSPSLYNTTIVVKNSLSHSTYDIRSFINSYFYDNCLIIINEKYKSKKVLFKDQDNRSVTVEYC